MKQLVQNLKSGEMKLLDVPVPALKPRHVLVRVHYSLISAGTEAMKVSTARKGYLGKAKEKPEQVKQVLETLKREGIVNTYRKVMNKLDSWAPLGYSNAGVIIDVAPDVTEFKVGQRVACAGQDIANHAEVIAVPVHLAAPVPDDVSLAEAAYTTVGAIAMQGVRQADLRLGESALVIGLGLLGQITVQLLKAAGISVVGMDINPEMVERAKKIGADLALWRNDPQLEQAILNFTDGYGVDAVIITAATHSLDPVELAGRVARKKGRVVIVGAVPTGFSRENYYKKELELRMSTSYGPGRYDVNYEEKGVDYPYAYVRWTENRNMRAFLKLIEQKKIDIQVLTTHQFPIEEALSAYELILKRTEPFLGILLQFDPEKPVESRVQLQPTPQSTSNIGVGFIGAGSFAQTFLIPNIKKANANLIGVVTTSGHTARSVADRFGFQFASTDENDLLTNKAINTVFIATPHHLHGPQVLKALKAGKHVFVEKPLALHLDEVEKIEQFYFDTSIRNKPMLMVGFNRRFAPLIKTLRETFDHPPVAIQYRINAGFIPPDHWTQDIHVGGGRIIGEVCHFMDLAMFLAASRPVRIHAVATGSDVQLSDTVSIQMEFENHSIATINYFSNGSKAMPKERLEIFGHGVSAVLDDFKVLHVYHKKQKTYRLKSQDKGHRNEIVAFLKAIQGNGEVPIALNEVMISSKLPFYVIESLRSGQSIKI